LNFNKLRVLIPQERENVIQLITTDYVHFLRTKEGATLFCNGFDFLDAKNKKLILKGFKGKVFDYLEHNPYAYLVIIKIINSVDDTVLVKKSILNVKSIIIINFSGHKQEYRNIHQSCSLC
jgi:hypothetical protein